MANKEQFQDALNALHLKKEKQLLDKQERSDDLIVIALESIDVYEAEIASLLPEAKQSLSEIILPWWQALKSSLGNLEIGKPLLVYSPSEYLYPHHAYRALEQGHDLHESDVTPSMWSGTFWIDTQNGSPRLYSRRLVKNGGFAFALQSKRYEVEITEGREITGPHLIHPQTIIQLAEAIESGQVWENLATGIK